MIKSMEVGFCFIGYWCYSEWWEWDLTTLAVLGKSTVSRVIPRLYGWVCKTLRLSLLIAEHSAVIISARLNPMRSQISIPVLWNLCSESVGCIKFWNRVKDSDTDGPMRGGMVGQKSYLGPGSFSSQDFSRSNKHYTFWYVSTGYFCALFL